MTSADDEAVSPFVIQWVRAAKRTTVTRMSDALPILLISR